MATTDDADPRSTVAQVARLADVGYVLIRSLLDDRAVEDLRVAFPSATPGSTLHVAIDDETPNVEEWRSLVDRPGIAELVAEVLGTVEVSVHGRDPGPGAGAQGLHADRPPGRVHAVDGLTLLWMLDEVTEDDGAPRVVPRSHRGGAAVPRSLAQPGARHPDEVVIVGRPGDVLVFDSHLWHSGRRNQSGARRRVVQMTVTRADLPRAAQRWGGEAR